MTNEADLIRFCLRTYTPEQDELGSALEVAVRLKNTPMILELANYFNGKCSARSLVLSR